MPFPVPTRLPRTRSQWVATILLAVVALAFWWWQNRAEAPQADRPAERPSANATVDAESGLAWVPVEELPAEAAETLELIDDGGPFPYERDGITFENREGVLPDHERGYYEEYTVPTPGEGDRGARRIVTGDDDEYFWTGDHYDSFERIAR